MCASYVENLNNNIFKLKTLGLLFFVHLRSQQKTTENVISSITFIVFPFDIVILRVAIISNFQNVRLQRRHRPTPTDDASTRQWRRSQQTGPVLTTR